MLDSQGFTISSKTAEKGVKGASTVAEHMHPASVNLNAEKQAHIIAKDAVGIIHGQAQGDSTDHKIKGLRKFQGGADMLWTAEFGGMLGGGALGWVATKTKKEKFIAGVKAVFTAPFEALRETKLNEIHHLPANYMKIVARDSKIVGGKATEWANAAGERAQVLKASGDNLAEKMHVTTAPVLTPVKEAVGSGLNRFESTGVGTRLLGGLQKGAAKFATAKSEAHLKHLSKAEQALTLEVPSFFGKIKNFFTGNKPGILPAHEALKDVTRHLGDARAATSSAERVMHMASAKEVLKTIPLADAETSLVKRVGRIGTYIGKSNNAVKAAHQFEHASSQNLAGVTKSLVKAAGHIPVFAAVIGLGVAAGVTATVMTHKKETKISRQMHNEIAGVIGSDSALMQSIDQAYHKNRGKHLMKTSMTLVSDLANGAMAASPAAGGMGYMAAAMLPMGVSALVQENPLLNAYANLRQEETGGAKLPPAAKLGLLRQLVGSVPSVAAHGGPYNRLTEPVAEAIMDQNLSAKDTMRLLANENKFSALATDVLEKQKAATATVAAAAPESTQQDHSKAPGPAAKPSIVAASVVNEGRISHMGKAAAV